MRVYNKSMSLLQPIMGRGVLLKRAEVKRAMGLLPYSGFGKAVLPYTARGCSKMAGSVQMKKIPGYNRVQSKRRVGGQFFKPVDMSNNPGQAVGPQSAGPLA